MAGSRVSVVVSKSEQALLNDYRMRVAVGIHQEQGRAAHTDEFGESGQKLIDVAAANEFGVGVPERSFVRAWADTNKSKNQELIAKQVQKAFKDSDNASVVPNLERGLERAALSMEASMRARIHAGIRPENSPATIARKGSATPLVDTGQLQAAVRGVSKVKTIKRRVLKVKK